MQKFEVIESKRWIHTSGKTASIYGAVPYLSEDDQKHWSIEVVGFTVRNNQTGTVGVGRAPWKTKTEAQAFADKFN
jgi:hypothetical protein